MKKIVLKSIIVTFCVALILIVATFGILSLCAPVAMMHLTDSLGLKGLCGDYAYQEYERSGNIECLARSFIYSADLNRYATADKRFTVLYETEKEGFEAYCEDRDASLDVHEKLYGYTFRSYVCGEAASVKYHLAGTEEAKEEVFAFALSETLDTFPKGNPLVALTLEALGEDDSVFCTKLYDYFTASKYSGEYYESFMRMFAKEIQEVSI